MVATVMGAFGRIDVLVNCAGIVGSDAPPHEITNEQWDYVMNTNLKGPFFCTKYAIPYLKKTGGGSVVNVSSIMGMLAGPTMVYNTSKSGVRHMTKNDAYIYAKDNIRFNSARSSFVPSPAV